MDGKITIRQSAEYFHKTENTNDSKYILVKVIHEKEITNFIELIKIYDNQLPTII